jgi:hypothetical protein
MGPHGPASGWHGVSMGPHMGLAWGRMGPHGVSMGPHGPAWAAWARMGIHLQDPRGQRTAGDSRNRNAVRCGVAVGWCSYTNTNPDRFETPKPHPSLGGLPPACTNHQPQMGGREEHP